MGILLQGVQEALHVISVCGGVMAGDGQGHEDLILLWEELARRDCLRIASDFPANKIRSAIDAP